VQVKSGVRSKITVGYTLSLALSSSLHKDKVVVLRLRCKLQNSSNELLQQQQQPEQHDSFCLGQNVGLLFLHKESEYNACNNRCFKRTSIALATYRLQCSSGADEKY
jgi:hypothetical protein